MVTNVPSIDKNIEDITVSAKSTGQRIVALDIIRGFFLAVILIDHIELYPSGFDLFTGRGRLLVSAAEGFFFMSGLLVGMVYKRRIAQGMRFIFKKMWTRAFQLYVGSVALSLFFTAAAVYLNHPNIKDGLYSVIDWPHILKETVLMRYGFGWADFLDRFAILMLMAPVSFYLLVKRKWWLMAGISLVAWLFRGGYFTLSWQIIFNMAMLLGFYWHEALAKWQSLSTKTQRRIKKWIVSVTALSFSLSYLSVYVLSLLNQKLLGLPHWLNNLTLHWNSANAWVWLYAQKWTMGPLRIVLFMFWFAVMFMFVQKHWRGINRISRGKIELLGRNSLFVYITHAFIVFVFKLFIPDQTNLLDNFLITAAALALLIIITVKYKQLEPLIRSKVGMIARQIKKPFLKLEPGQ